MAKTEPKTKGTKPAYRMYRVEGDGENAHWTPIGAAWAHRDGKGFSITCDAVPLQGRIVMRVPKDKEPA